MNIIFTKQYLADLYEGNSKPYKQYKSNPQLIKQYVKTINKLKAILNIDQLYQMHSLRYEKKTGNLKGISAVWINKQYRLLFKEVATAEKGLIIDLLEIQDISKHYEK